MNVYTRRKALIAISQAAALSALAACTDTGSSAEAVSAPLPVSDTVMLASIAYDLFPYPELSPALYVKAAERIQALNSPVVRDGLAKLKTLSGSNSWVDLPEETRLFALTAVQGTELFTVLRTTTIEVLYREPETFAMVGYGGSAIEKGGYLNRGFDDISWLPQSGQGASSITEHGE